MADQLNQDLEKGEDVTPVPKQLRRRQKLKFTYDPPEELKTGKSAQSKVNPYKTALPDTSTIWQQVHDKNETGQWNFERFESMQLLNLCLLQHEIRETSEEIYDVVRERATIEGYWDIEEFPVDRVKEPAARIRALLKEAQLIQGPDETLIAVNSVMAFPKAPFGTIKEYDGTKYKAIPRIMVDIRHDLEPDGLRKLLTRFFPSWVKSTFACFGFGPGKFMKARNAIKQPLPDYTKARAKEHEDEAFRVVVDNTARLIVSIFAGASLLVPMILMIFSKSSNANLIICSVFVLAFGAIISFGTKSSNQEIVGATAAYAAVLVVFIGASS
ncbi:uncharacterized protein PV09_09071 [Verruconis gallopava]|uniref:DUF6594 domain-containing protein n=1 Tax=Verruconis gallopava TaxID=253628 RepID=A0A0D1ZXM2_9PEZI|nr:uncharacterized protein PV09_09071 [Verruconis gallopava]KIV99207.1 hypothetical protein PV09_09071 [Verruconis gallopava]